MTKNVLIAGCSSGFGRLTAVALARRGQRVFATMRNHADADELISLAALQRRESIRWSCRTCGI
ncbi:SDR family NAD(P)-dependent oxidoreductase [Nocardia sp. NPDC051929]|uniref:SDR family NAD(P)-dependent oxidoreductase n=1 Tax=unclassified Nocardia TaxID=2637762 RepID=UPI00342BED2F